jgi:hypothetical protein
MGDKEMIRRALLLLAMVGIYKIVQRALTPTPISPSLRSEEARWANEGGAIPPASAS